jgi:hypothetical protein
MCYAALGGDTPSSCTTHNVYRLGLQSKRGGEETLNAIEVKVICAPMYKPCIPSEILQSCINEYKIFRIG